MTGQRQLSIGNTARDGTSERVRLGVASRSARDTASRIDAREPSLGFPNVECRRSRGWIATVSQEKRLALKSGWTAFAASVAIRVVTAGRCNNLLSCASAV